MLLFLSACATPSQKFANHAKQLGFEQQQIIGAPFRHTLYISSGKLSSAQAKSENTLHIYIDGDGTPWLKNRYPNPDPTPQNPMLLQLMAKDPQPSLYLGRPCYHHVAQTADFHCDKRYWTNKRYAKIVVDSLHHAIVHYLKQNKTHIPPNMVLIGFSGGGTLSMLLAPYLVNLTKTMTVITLAGNLDTQKWAQYHHYLPLSGSLNPAQQAPLPASITQLHLLGIQDQNILELMIKPVIERQDNARFIRLAKTNHHCCWHKFWPDILRKKP